MKKNTSKDISSVDSVPPVSTMATYGLQHVLVMYTGAIAMPMMISVALGLSTEETTLLIQANLFTAGIATVIQTIGFWRFGARIPLIQGCSFVALTPIIMIGREYGIAYIFGSVIVCGALTIAIAPMFSRLLRFFPPVVIGVLITIIGVSLIPTAARWLGGGDLGADDFGSFPHLFLGFITVAVTLFFYTKFSGFIANISVLIGLLAGALLSIILGQVDFSPVGDASWFGTPTPFAFGLPKFSVMPILLMFISMMLIMAETTGTSVAIGKLVDRDITPNILANAFRSDGLSTVIGGVFNSFPYNAFVQNTGLIALTGIKSRYVVSCSGIILMLFGLFPKLAAIISAIPASALGGSAIIMFGMTAVTGIRQLAQVKYEGTQNSLIVAVSLGIGLIPISFPELFDGLHGVAGVITHSGIFMATITAVLLNILLNGFKPKDSLMLSDEKNIQGSESKLVQAK